MNGTLPPNVAVEGIKRDCLFSVNIGKEVNENNTANVELAGIG